MDNGTALGSYGYTGEPYFVRSQKMTPDEMKKYLEDNPFAAMLVAEYYPEHRLLALSIDGRGLIRLPKKEQSFEEIEAAVIQNGYAIRYASKRILKRHPDLYRVAINSNGAALEFVPEEYRYEGIYEDALRSNGEAIAFFPDELITSEVCLKAVQKTPTAIKFVPTELIDRELAFEAVSGDGLAIGFVPRDLIDGELAFVAVSADGRAIRHVPKELVTEEMCFACVRSYPEAIAHGFIPDDCLSMRVVETAIVGDWRSVGLYVRPSARMLLLAYKQSPLAIQFFPPELIRGEIVRDALERSPLALVFLPVEFATVERIRECLSDYAQRSDEVRKDINKNVLSDYLGKLDDHLLRDGEVCKDLDLLGLRRINTVKWEANEGRFRILEEVGTVCTLDEFGGTWVRTSIARTYEARSLDELQELVDDFSIVDFGSYPFDDYDPSRHDLSSAHLSASAQRILGRFDNSAYTNLVVKNRVLLGHQLDEREDSNYMPEFRLASARDTGISRIVYYISDLHLDQKLADRFPTEASRTEINDYLESIVDELVGGISAEAQFRNVLLFLGDVSFNFDLNKLFFTILRRRWRSSIVVVLGEHELWHLNGNDSEMSAQTVDEVTENYRAMLGELWIHLLQNDLFLLYRGFEPRVVSFSQLASMSDEDLSKLLKRSPITIIGGTGFTGNNATRNAASGLYRGAVSSVEEDKRRSRNLEELVERIEKLNHVRSVIVATHTPLRDWSSQPRKKDWVYISGHTHDNARICECGICALEDNQVGYSKCPPKLKGVCVEARFDPFLNYPDGIFEADPEDYLDFGRYIGEDFTSFDQKGSFTLVKRNGLFLFLFVSEKTGSTYMPYGGRIRKLAVDNPAYYFDNMTLYSELFKAAFNGHFQALDEIAKEVKSIGGDGIVYDSVVHVESLNCVQLDALTGELAFTCRWTEDGPANYRSFEKLVEKQLPRLTSSFAEFKIQHSQDSALILQTKIDSAQIKVHKENLTATKLKQLLTLARRLIYGNVIQIWDEELVNMPKPDLSLYPPKAVKPSAKQNNSSSGRKRGRPSMRDPIASWRRDHPGEGLSRCANDLGISIATVRKWWDS